MNYSTIMGNRIVHPTQTPTPNSYESSRKFSNAGTYSKTFGQRSHSEDYTVRMVCRLIEMLISTFPAMPFGPLHNWNLERFKLKHLNRSGWNLNAKCTLDYTCTREIQWWIQNLPYGTAPIRRPNHTILMTTDASKRGWGQW